MPETPWFNNFYVGRGCDPATGRTYGTAITFDAEQPATSSLGQRIVFSLETLDSSYDLSQRLNISAAASFAGGAFNISLEGSFTSQRSFNRYYTYGLVSIQVINPPKIVRSPRLTPEAFTLLQEDGWDRFAESYGLEYVAGYIEGGSFYGLIEIETHDAADQQEIKAKLSASVGPFKLDGSLESTLKEAVKDRAQRVFVLKIGSSGQIVNTNLEAMIAEAQAFPVTVLQNPVIINALVETYQNTVPLPDILPASSLPRIHQRRMLEDLGKDYLRYKDYKASLEIVLSRLPQFDEYRGLSEAEMIAKRREYQNDIIAVSEHINLIVRQARRCYEEMSECTELTSHVPIKPLPTIGGDQMGLQQLEDQLRSLELKLEQRVNELTKLTTDGVNNLSRDIQQGRLVADRARMLQARDSNHWMRFNHVDVFNRDTFRLWRTDNQWFSLIQVDHAAQLQCSPEFQWQTGQPNVRMWHSSRAVAVLTWVHGDVEELGVRVFIGDGGYWYLGGITPMPVIPKVRAAAKARCIGAEAPA